jgi:LysR family transcriptional regulator, hydrogen peroxide-inducible genes activator
MEMHEIQYFLAVCETLNFNRAAERCAVSQPALTRAIQKLEDELGGLLFRRGRHGTRLTELGHLMRRHLAGVLQHTEAARATAKQFLRLEAAPMTLGVMCTIGPLKFIRFLNEFRHQQPGIQLTLVETVPSRLCELLLDDAADVTLMAQPAPFDPRLQVTPIYRERFVVAFPIGHRFAERQRVHVSEMRGESYLSRVNCEFRQHLDEMCRNHGVNIESSFRSEREDWIQTMIAAGMGVCFMPEYSATHPGIGTRPIEPAVAREVSLVTVAGRAASPPAAALIAAVGSYPWSAESACAAAG